VREKLADPKLSGQEAVDWSSRGFWLEPSLWHWWRVGTALERAAKQQCEVQSGDEGTDERPVKCRKEPQFDAMKEALAKSVVSVLPLAELRAHEPQNQRNDLHVHYSDALRRARPTPVKPSFFARSDTPVIARSFYNAEDALVLADALSAVKGTPVRMKVTAATYYNSRLEQNRGLWDVGKILLTFNEPAPTHAITTSGSVLTLSADAMAVDLGGGECVNLALKWQTRRTAGPAGSGEVILSWVGKAPEQESVTVTSRRSDGHRPEDKLVIDDIDVNGDGIPDFSRWRGRFVPSAESEGLWTAILANLGGEWVLIDYEESEDCT
jgi:hypothetical protein